MKTYRTYNQNQISLIPQTFEDLLRPDHVALFINDVIDELDISEIEYVYKTELRGYPPYHPRMMLKILIYGYCTGVRSSRKLAQKCEDEVAFRFLTGNNFPKFRAIANFRERHLAAFHKLFIDVLTICSDSGLVKLGHVSLDGTKVKANASKHKAMSYERMQKELETLHKEIAALIAEAEEIDRAEDKKYGKNKRGDEIPKSLRRKEDRLKKIRKAKAALENESPRKRRTRTMTIRRQPLAVKTNTTLLIQNPGSCRHRMTKRVLFKDTMPKWLLTQRIKSLLPIISAIKRMTKNKSKKSCLKLKPISIKNRIGCRRMPDISVKKISITYETMRRLLHTYRLIVKNMGHRTKVHVG